MTLVVVVVVVVADRPSDTHVLPEFHVLKIGDEISAEEAMRQLSSLPSPSRSPRLPPLDHPQPPLRT